MCLRNFWERINYTEHTHILTHIHSLSFLLSLYHFLSPLSRPTRLWLVWGIPVQQTIDYLPFKRWNRGTLEQHENTHVLTTFDGLPLQSWENNHTTELNLKIDTLIKKKNLHLHVTKDLFCLCKSFISLTELRTSFILLSLDDCHYKLLVSFGIKHL